MPALWMVTDLGETSKIEAGGLLMMGGIAGFYIMLAFRKLRFEAFRNKLQLQSVEKDANKENLSDSQGTITVKGKSLAEFLE